LSAPRLLVTVDVEEDMPEWRVLPEPRVTNARALPRFHELCAEFGVRPTYLCTYPMATEPDSARVLASLVERGDCEIGTHLHAWSTPPYLGVPAIDGDERLVPYYQSQLPRERLCAKLAVLHGAVERLAGRAPTSFRAGRFGLDATSLGELAAFGYRVDTSVTPLVDHTPDGGPDFRSAPQLPYHPSAADPSRPGSLPIVEIPVSIALTRRLRGRFSKYFVRLPRALRVRGLLSRDYLNLVDFAWLYPARFDLDLMKKVCATLVRGGTPVLNAFLHSSELVPGLAYHGRSDADCDRVFARLRGLFAHCIDDLGARPATLEEAAPHVEAWLGAGRRAAPAEAAEARSPSRAPGR
jgi:hypothetical protein